MRQCRAVILRREADGREANKSGRGWSLEHHLADGLAQHRTAAGGRWPPTPARFDNVGILGVDEPARSPRSPDWGDGGRPGHQVEQLRPAASVRVTGQIGHSRSSPETLAPGVLGLLRATGDAISGLIDLHRRSAPPEARSQPAAPVSKIRNPRSC